MIHSFEEVAKGADLLLGDLKTKWYQFGIGAAGAQHALTQFQVKHESLMPQGKDKEASDLLRGTRESAQKVLEAQQQIKAANARQTRWGWPSVRRRRILRQRMNCKKAGVGYTDKEVQAQQTLVDALNAQLHIESRVAEIKKQDSSNASASTGKELAPLQADTARSAAEHRAKMAEISLSGEKAQSEAELSMHNASIAERLAADTRLADEEYRIQLRGNQELVAALDKGGKDYNAQLQSLHQKAEELTAQHASNTETISLPTTQPHQWDRELLEPRQTTTRQILRRAQAYLYLHLKEAEFRFNHRNHDLYRTLLTFLGKDPL